MRDFCIVIDGHKTVRSFKFYVNGKAHYENIKHSNYEELRLNQIQNNMISIRRAPRPMASPIPHIIVFSFPCITQKFMEVY